MLKTVFFGLLLSALLGCAEDPITPTPPPFVIDSAEKVVEGLERAYRQRDYGLLEKLLANDPDRNAEFLFLLSEVTEEGDDRWGYFEESRLHRRMFRPDDLRPGDRPVPNDAWLETVDITLKPVDPFSEWPEVYSTNGGADGKLDPNVWRATRALYSADVFFAMVGDTDYHVKAWADFVVIEDLTKSQGETGRFLLFIWKDSPFDRGFPKPGDGVASEGRTWSAIKVFYL